MVLPESRTPLLHDPNGSGVIGRQGSESIDDKDGRAEVIYVPEGFEVREGLKLTEGYKVGKELGGGHQGAVYELLDGKGKESGQVLKALKAKKATPITGADVGLKREWLIGQQLNNLSKDNKDIPGFMFTGAALVSGAGGGNAGMLEGLVIEKLNGWDIEKRVLKEDFNDVFYLMDMVKQVLASLDKAFQKLGFVHADMRISNVMEHHLDAEPMYPKGFTSRKQRKQAVGVLTEPQTNTFKIPGQKQSQHVHFKIIDYGHARLSHHNVRRKMPKIPVFEKCYQKIFASKGDVWRLLSSLNDVVDGRTWPESSEPEVKALNGLIREVTGIKPLTFWQPAEASNGNGSHGNGSNGTRRNPLMAVGEHLNTLSHPRRTQGRLVTLSKSDLEDPLSHAIGSRVLCVASFDSGQHIAEIVEQKTLEPDTFLYYVHYVDLDKRLDEWVVADKVSAYDGAQAAQQPLLSHTSSGLADAAAAADITQKMTRRLKRRYDEIHHTAPNVEELAPIDQHLEKEHQEKTKVKNIEVVELGRYDIDTWYYSPYPEPFASEKKLYICEYTLKYFKKKKTLVRHLAKTPLRHPPGDEIYRSPDPGHYPGDCATTPTIAVFEVDGKKNKVYCQSLCLLSKLFLDHKTLYYDVDPFLFYILCECDAEGYHIVGYFSKEKHSVEGYNLACILTLPPYQRKGYGRFLISFSYELSRKENRVGTPERPLSDLGQVSYRSYWTRVLLDLLREHRHHLSIKEIAELTAIRTDDIVKTLESLGLIKYWKGDHIISVTPRIIDEHMRTAAVQKTIGIDTGRLHWTPYMVPPANMKK